MKDRHVTNRIPQKSRKDKENHIQHNNVQHLHPVSQIRVVCIHCVIISDFPTNFTREIALSPTGSGLVTCLFEICNYQGHPYLMWKTYNIVWITLVYNIFRQFYFVHTFSNFFQTLQNSKKPFLIDHHYKTKSESFDTVAFVRIH